MNTKIINSWVAKENDYEGAKMSSEVITEKSGWIPAKNRIQNLMMAGGQLIERRKQLDFSGMYQNMNDKPWNTYADRTEIEQIKKEMFVFKSEAARKAEERRISGEINTGRYIKPQKESTTEVITGESIE